MPQKLASYLLAEMDARGWKQSDLADKAGVKWPTLNNIGNDPSVMPERPTLAALATALGAPAAAR